MDQPAEPLDPPAPKPSGGWVRRPPGAARAPEQYVAAYGTLMVLVFASIAYLGFSVGTDKDDWVEVAARMRSWGDRPWSPFFLLAAYTTGSLLAMPGLVMLTVMVTCLGPVLGPCIALTGTAISAAALHAFGRWLGRDAFHELYPAQMAQLEQLLVGHSLLRVIQMRLLPVLPFHLVNAVCGLVGIPLGSYLLGTVIGLTPKMLVQLYFVRTLLAGLTAPGTVFLWNLAVGCTLFVMVTALGIYLDRYIRRTKA